jgi:hypothetical protein
MHNIIGIPEYVGYSVLGIGAWVLSLLLILKMKTQVFFQRAYIDIEGDFVHQFLNMKYLYYKLDVQLFNDISYIDQKGETQKLTITRVSKTFVQTYLNRGQTNSVSNTLETLITIAEKLNLEVKGKGYY